ncbi:MAG: hypothetical protein JOZ87_31080 [Chloroflexi bacterium]|nr:hypothetical protein [Chloroflexota bacterium]
MCQEVRREPIHRAPPAEHPLSVLVLRSYAAQRGRSTYVAARQDRRLPGQMPSGAVHYQGVFRGVSEDYHRFVARLAATQHIQIVEPPKGVRREEWVEPFYQHFGSRFGIVVILKSRENASAAAACARSSTATCVGWTSSGQVSRNACTFSSVLDKQVLSSLARGER